VSIRYTFSSRSVIIEKAPGDPEAQPPPRNGRCFQSPENEIVHTLLLLAALPLFPPSLKDLEPFPQTEADQPCEIEQSRLSPSRELSKKEAWLAEKATRIDIHLSSTDLPRSRAPVRRATTGTMAALMPPAPGSVVVPVTTLYNLRTRETLSLVPGIDLAERFHRFLRDHYTNQITRMDGRLVDVLSSVARRFGADRIEVVSGYRSPKYNVMLRKKGREVARTSQHVEGNAVDFRLRGIPTKRLLNYVRSLKIGGVGYYPHSQFVHSDTGRIRYWRGS
jgi:hypothetical protein